MAIHLNIGSTSTVKYRTDCFETGSRTDYHIQKSPNIAIPDAINDQDNYYYDVGSYGSERGGFPTIWNPIICDNLLIGGSFQDPSVVSDSVYYDEILFSRPMIALDRTSVRGISGEQITLRYDTFSVIDRLYTDLQYKVCRGTGIQYRDGTPYAFDGVFDNPIIKTQEPIVRMSFVLETRFPTYPYHSVSNWNNIISADKLSYVFSNGRQYHAFWNQISQYEYGIIWGWNRDASMGFGEPMLIRYQVETQSGNIEIADFRYDSRFKYYYIIPFLSQDEYDAAYAANYPWNSTIKKQIDKYYFNKFK